LVQGAAIPGREYKDVFTELTEAKPHHWEDFYEEGHKHTGTVRWYNPVKGVGFIAPDGPGYNVFFHKSSVASGYTPQPGEAVRYQDAEVPLNDAARAAHREVAENQENQGFRCATSVEKVRQRSSRPCIPAATKPGVVSLAVTWAGGMASDLTGAMWYGRRLVSAGEAAARC